MNENFTYEAIQNFADEFTCRIMHSKYGERFDKCDDLETDSDMNKDWEYLNERFYDLIDTWSDLWIS